MNMPLPRMHPRASRNAHSAKRRTEPKFHPTLHVDDDDDDADQRVDALIMGRKRSVGTTSCCCFSFAVVATTYYCQFNPTSNLKDEWYTQEQSNKLSQE